MPEIDRSLVFDIWGDYAHFRKAETTTSPLTHLIPPRTVLCGLIAAICGLPRDDYNEEFSEGESAFGIRIISPIRTFRINLNLIDTSMSIKDFYFCRIRKNPRTQIPSEFLKQPKYRVYVWLKDKKRYEKLKRYLKNHKTFYTPYLGITELICNFLFIEELECEGPFDEEKEVNTIVRMDKVQIEIEEGKKYGKERIPLFMNQERVVQEYADMLFEVNGKPLKIKKGEFYKVGEENVTFF